MSDIEKFKRFTNHQVESVELDELRNAVIRDVRGINDQLQAHLEEELRLKEVLSKSLILAKNKAITEKMIKMVYEEMEFSNKLVNDNVCKKIESILGGLEELEELIVHGIKNKPTVRHLAGKFGIPDAEFYENPYAEFHQQYGHDLPNQKVLRAENRKLLRALEYWVKKMRKKYDSDIKLRDIVPASNKNH